jgi:hypothetical protein
MALVLGAKPQASELAPSSKAESAPVVDVSDLLGDIDRLIA